MKSVLRRCIDGSTGVPVDASTEVNGIKHLAPVDVPSSIPPFISPMRQVARSGERTHG
jgi:hypothetical protein